MTTNALPVITMLTVPYPPSANVYWKLGRGRIYVSQEAQVYKTEVGWLCAGLEPTDRPVVLTLKVYCPRINNDLDNTIKVLCDALQGHLFINDVQIVELHVFRFQANKSTCRVEIAMEIKES